jgi:replication factor C small subunit
MIPLTEHYRPDKMQNMITSNFDIDYFKQVIKEGKLKNHILLIGSPGIGKSTLIKILLKELNVEYLYINASLENGVDIVREKVIGFASKKNSEKIERWVWLEECDRLSSAAWDSLKAIFEDYVKNIKVVATCNNYEKIVPPILSRFQKFFFKQIEKKDCLTYIKDKMTVNGIKCKDEDLEKIYKMTNGDMRDFINTLQQNIINDKLDLKNSDNLLNDFITVYKEKDLKKLQVFLNENEINYDLLFRILYEKIKSGEKIIKLAKYMSNKVIDKEINFVACCCDLWRTE